MMSDNESPSALEGIRVTDLTDDLGYAGKLFADLGADVVLVEPPGGCSVRFSAPFLTGVAEPERSLRFQYLHAGKRGVVADPKNPEDRELLRSLLLNSDIVFDDKPQRHWGELGLSYEDIRPRNPSVIWCTITPFGQTDGPHVGFQADDAVAMSMGGMAALTGYDDTGPLIAAGNLSIMSAAQYAAVMTMLCFVGRSRGTGGQFIDVSIQEVVALGTETAPQFFDLKGHIRRRLGEAERQAGIGVYRCRDGEVHLLCSESGLGSGWNKLVEWLIEERIPGAEVLAEQQWLANTFKAQPVNKAKFRKIFETFSVLYPKQYLFEEGQRRHIALAPINNAADVCADPHLRERCYFVEIGTVEGRPIRGPGAPYQMSRTPWRARRRAPLLNEHTELVRRGPFGSADRRAATCAAAADKPLRGVRVLDFTWVGAGPFTTKILADFGAEVIKIESRTKPDQLRRAEPLVGARGLDESGYFANRNTNKKSITLNLKEAASRPLIHRLLKNADIVANSFSPDVMDKYGLSYQDVCAINPRIIYLSMPLAGSSGPYKKFVGYGSSIAAIVGMMNLSGLPNRRPVGTGTNYPDHLPNPLHAAFAVLAALAYCDRTGEGQEINISQIESTLSVFPEPALDFLANGNVAQPGEYRNPKWIPQGIFPCAGDDEWCAITVRGDDEFKKLWALMGNAFDARFATAEGRLNHEDEVRGLLAEWTRSKKSCALMKQLQEAGIAAGRVQTAKDILTSDVHLAARGFWRYLEHPVMGRSVYHGIAAKFSDMTTEYRSSAPCLGQHNPELMQLCGLSQPEFESLVASKVIA